MKAGIGRVAVISGEPGVGKSRLVSEWKATLGDGEHLPVGWIEGHCLSYGKTIAYQLVSGLLRSMAGMTVTSNQADTRLALQNFVRKLLGGDWGIKSSIVRHLTEINPLVLL